MNIDEVIDAFERENDVVKACYLVLYAYIIGHQQQSALMAMKLVDENSKDPIDTRQNDWKSKLVNETFILVN